MWDQTLADATIWNDGMISHCVRSTTHHEGRLIKNVVYYCPADINRKLQLPKLLSGARVSNAIGQPRMQQLSRS